MAMRINVRDLMSPGLDAQSAFKAAFDLCRGLPVVVPGVVAFQSSGVVYVPAGVYELTDNLEIPYHVRLEGEGPTSILAFANGGLRLPRQPDSNFYSSNVIRDLSVINTNPANEHAGFDMLGGAGVQIERVWSAGWNPHYIIDQGELVSFDQCSIGGLDFGPVDVPTNAIGILFKDPPREPATTPGVTNSNWVSRCHFSIAGNPIVFEGGEQLIVDRCNFFDCGPLVMGGNRASILYCFIESRRGTERIRVDAPEATGAISLEITGCSFASPTAAIRFNTTAVLGFTFNGNLCRTTHLRNEDKEVIEERHVIENLPLQLVGPLIILGNINDGDAPMFAAECSEVALYASSVYAGGVGQRDRVGIGTVQPQAVLDIRGGAENPTATPWYGLQVRAGEVPIRQLRMVPPPNPPGPEW